MTRVNIPDDVDFEFVSDVELGALLGEAMEAGRAEIAATGTDDVILDLTPEMDLDNLFGEPEVELAAPLFDYTEEQWISELDLAFENAITPTNRFERGVGYCENVACADYLKGLFLMMHEGDDFECGACNTRSTHMIAERGIVDRVEGVPFTTVRVEYCYEPAQGRFQEIVSITDEGYVGAGGTYTVLNPLCRTPKRAEKIAEALLTIINQGVALEDELSGNVPRTHEKILSFDKPADEFRKDLKELEQRLRDNSFLQQPSVFSASSEVELNLEEGDSSGPESNDAGGTTNPQPRVSPAGDSGTRALYLYPSDQPSRIRPERSEGRLHPVQPMGRRSKDLRGRKSKGGRSGNHRSTASKLRAAARRYLSPLLRGKGRGSTSGT